MKRLPTSRFWGMKGVALGILVTATLLLASCGSGDDEGETPTPSANPDEVTEVKGASEPMEVNIGSGTALVWGDGVYGVVLVHGAIYDAASWTDQAEAIAAKGFSVIAVEHATADDTSAAIDYLRRTHAAEAVALIGASAGTGPVLAVASDQAAEPELPVDLVVILAGSGSVESLNIPSVMFISAEGDGAASAAKRMMEATSGDPADLVIVPGSAHAQALFLQPEGEQVLTAILDRLTARRASVTQEP